MTTRDHNRQPSIAPRLLHVRDAARYAAIGRTVAYRLIATGDWPSIRIGRSRRVAIDDIDAWIADKKRAAAAAATASAER